MSQSKEESFFSKYKTNKIPLNEDFDYLDQLNPQQKYAVTNIDENPLLILAGAGTGKTKVLVSRMFHLISQKKIPPYKIIAITFTNQAMKNIKDRFSLFIKNIPKISTFHSFCAEVLRRHCNVINMSSNFNILDRYLCRKIVKELIHYMKIDEKKCSITWIMDRIDHWQNHGFNPEEIETSSLAENEEIPHKIYTSYMKRLQEQENLDFGGLIIKAIEVLRNPHVLKQYHQKISYIMVDEYQDVNPAQYMLLRLLCQRNDIEQGINLCCVGDEDQCIYEWRGSKVDHITHFQKDFKDSNIIKLEQNYRSTSHILNVANQLISNNKNRLDKRLFTQQDSYNASKVKLHVSRNSESELFTIVSEIKKCINIGIPLSNIAVLVRISLQTRSFETAFMDQGIPYKVIGGGFYDRLEIRNAISYLRLVCNKKNDSDFIEIINLPKRGIGKESLNKIKSHAERNQISLFKATEEIIEAKALQPKKIKTLQNFVNDIYRWGDNLKNHSESNNVAKIILEESGYLAIWKDDKFSEESRERYEYLTSLISIAREYETIQQFIVNASFREDNNNHLSQSPDYVQIMTLHAAKGLEFDTVFISGWEQGLFPHQRSLDAQDYEKELEGERRLAYVGITRARNNCHLFYVLDRRPNIYSKYNSDNYKNEPSQFLLELYNPDCVEEIIHDDIYGRLSDYRDNLYDKSHISSTTHTKFQVGNLIEHEKLGTGTILLVSGNKVYVDFNNANPKWISDSFINKIQAL
ncbi:MAG: DNA helicase II [Candidatus Liberibacter europaeus]|uniref:DNA 3'-5' helicase n=1 Tax=Candidatus Liberibacter europaeus TaxID=744859 RepID=A0A2T4VWY4_9HYPH|nr:DNA helicase II [Candidatus Liberibacter europaeus]PTL86286.1 MAG: DNA helicase II [Candidatus Liberibacter europaeus]